jgi:hypothetical protein
MRDVIEAISLVLAIDARTRLAGGAEVRGTSLAQATVLSWTDRRI